MTLVAYEPQTVPIIWLGVTDAVSDSIATPQASSEQPDFVPEPVWFEVGDISVAALMTVPVRESTHKESTLAAVITIDPAEAIARDKNFVSAWRGTYRPVADGANFRQWRRLFGREQSLDIMFTPSISSRQRIAVVRRQPHGSFVPTAE